MSAPSENQIQQEILLALGQRSDLRVWRNNVGGARTDMGVVKFGLVGSADISGILGADVFGVVTGRRLEIEVKSAIGRQSPKQRSFQSMITDMGGLYILARSLGEVEAALCCAGYPTGRGAPCAA